METKFNIIYAVRAFDGELVSGIIELISASKKTKKEVEANALSLLKSHINGKLGVRRELDRWMDNVQKIDLTVTQIQ